MDAVAIATYSIVGASNEFRRDEIDASGHDAVITAAATQHRHSNS
jgi:hypothetical protein